MTACALLVAVLVVTAVAAGEESVPESKFADRAEQDQFEGLVDEDEEFGIRQQAYAFNPVQARKELKIGIFYSKKGSHRAAAGRYLEATRWDSNLAEAYWRLGLAREKIAQSAEAIEAYAQFLNIEPTGKKAREVNKRLARLRKVVGELPLSAHDGPTATSP